MTGTIVITMAAAVLLIRDRGFALTIVAAVALIAMLAITVWGNVPLNAQIVSFPCDGTVEQWRDIRGRWELLHTVRVALDLSAFACLVAALARHGSA